MGTQQIEAIRRNRKLINNPMNTNNNLGEFVKIKGYEDLYEINSQGQVRSIKKNIILKNQIDRGYCKIELSKNGIGKIFKIHRLVWQSFIGEIPIKMQINHINGIRNDNRLENLEVVTVSQNILHSYRVLNRKITKGENHKNSKKIINIENGIYYDSFREASNALNIKYTTLCAQLNGQNNNYTSLRLI